MNIGELLTDKGQKVPLLSTVLRIDLSLQASANTRSRTIDILSKWLEERTEAKDLGFQWDSNALPFTKGNFSFDWAEDEDTFTFALDRPDNRMPDERSWLLDVSLRQVEAQPILSTRLSVRQSRELAMPAPGAPKFISEIVSSIGAWDVSQLADSAISVDEESIEPFCEFVASPVRTLPIIAISEG